MKKSQKMGTLYLIYVDGHKLADNEYLRELYKEEYGDDARYILFGVTTDKKLLDLFFTFHRKECFYLVKKPIHMTKDVMENLTKKFYDKVLSLQIISVGFWLDGVSVAEDTVMALTREELVQLGYELEMVDDTLYDLYCSLSLHKKILSKNCLTKEMIKLLNAIHYKDIIFFIEHAYGDYMDRGMNNGDGVSPLKFNEWGLLCSTYGSLLIGGEDDEDPYI